MSAPYSSQGISNYDASPPADDGSQVASNRITFAGVKTKLADPIKTRTDNIDSAIITAFGKVIGLNGVRTTAIDYTVVTGDQGKLIKVTASGVVITTPAAATVTSPFAFAVLNNSSGSITVDGNSSETIDGAATISIPSGAGVTVETDGTNWFSHGQNYVGTISPPQGRLTLTSGTPILSGDVSAATSVYYTPYTGNLCPIYNGTIYQMRSFAELTLTLSANSNYAASTLYDIFIFDSSGTVTVGMGPAWSTSTAGSGARGTGAGTTELQRLSGFWTNKVSMTARNGASTYTVAANQGTYIGSIFMDGTNGQVSCTYTYGQSRKWGIWNAFNRAPVRLNAGDSNASWNYSSSTVRIANNAAGNSLTVFSGLAEEFYDLRLFGRGQHSVGGDITSIGIGYNSTSANSGTTAQYYNPPTVTAIGDLRATYQAPPSLGINTVNALESCPSNGATGTFYGTQANMLLTAEWRA